MALAATGMLACLLPALSLASCGPHTDVAVTCLLQTFGQVKHTIGSLTGNNQQQAEGKAQQVRVKTLSLPLTNAGQM
jgi:hypothetical protein